MTVRVRLFAVVRDRAGVDAFEVEVPAGGSVADVRREIEARYPAVREYLARSAFAVNREYVREGVG